MIDKKILNEMLEVFKGQNPNPVSDLVYPNEYCFCVSVILSAQATDKGVNKATESLYKKVKTPVQMVNLGIDGLKEYIKSIGLYNNKAKSIMSFSKDLVEKYDSKIPADRDELEKLAGIGRKSANVIMNELHDAPHIGVDTHVLRLVKRLDLVDPSAYKNALKTEKELLRVIPAKYHNRISNWLVLHGRYVCKAKKPDCESCILLDLCPYYRCQKNT